MISATQATQLILESIIPFKDKSVEIEKITGRILRQSVFAERDQPPFNRATMDGIAIRFSSFKSNKRKYRIAATAYAGEPIKELIDPNDCIEIMTGAVIPNKADCIIPVEYLSFINRSAQINLNYKAEKNHFIHKKGSDYKRGTELLRPGKKITPMDIAIITSCGLESVLVSKQPTISILSNGNELISGNRAIKPHQIRLSNGPSIISMLQQQGFDKCVHEHLIDEKSILRKRISNHLDKSNIVIISGGVSMGKTDFIPDILKELAVDCVFHKISQRPGKPMWFGIGPQKQAIFSLPGNPVSSLTCSRQYVIPALYHASSYQIGPQEYVEIEQDITYKPKLTNFLPVKTKAKTNGKLIAKPIFTNTSGDFRALSDTDGYIELKSEKTHFKKGQNIPFHRWKLL